LLALLAANPSGCNEFLLLAHGHTVQLIEELIKVGLATRSEETTVTRIRITDAGRVALERHRS
jgi:predicted transcriptional regulator